VGKVEAGSRVVLDTDVLVANLRGKDDVLAKLTDAIVATTVVNAFELFHGAYKSRESSVNVPATGGLLSSLEILTLDLKTAERAGETLSQVQKAGSDVDIRDLLIGCIAKENGYSVVTNNVKHFQRIPGLRVVGPSQVG
jgi:tRNA(fMet)-specific endonuclease VapC